MHAHTHHVVIIAMFVVRYSMMSLVTLILYYHAFMSTLQTSLVKCALWLPQVWYLVGGGVGVNSSLGYETSN